MSRRPLRIAAYGYFGMGNIGNEGTLAAFLEHMRGAHPEVRLSCFAAGANAVRREHGIPATQLMTFRASTGRPGRAAKLGKGLSRLWDVPRTFALMRDVDVLVVPGTGVLESRLVTRPWGLPYWMFLAALSCRLRGRKVALLSVGAEHAGHPATRWFYRRTVNLAQYCSYRDRESQEAMRDMGGRRRVGGVYPDLAFSLPVPEERPERSGHVVLGVMAYDGRPGLGRASDEVRQTYVEDVTRLVTTLAEEGRSVTMVVGDVADRGLALEIAARVRSVLPDLAPERLSVSRADTMAGIMDEMAQAEVVVASRLHNVVCALMLRKPTVSLGYAEKNARIMDKFGLGRFCQPIDTFDVDLLLDQMAEVQRVQPGMEAHMKETLQMFRDELAEQYQEFAMEVLSPSQRGRATRPAQRRRQRG